MAIITLNEKMIGFGSLSKWTHIQSTLKFESCVNNDNECSAFEDSRRHNQFGNVSFFGEAFLIGFIPKPNGILKSPN